MRCTRTASWTRCGGTSCARSAACSAAWPPPWAPASTRTATSATWRCPPPPSPWRPPLQVLCDTPVVKRLERTSVYNSLHGNACVCGQF